MPERSWTFAPSWYETWLQTWEILMVFFIWIGATSGFLKRIPQEKPWRFLHHPKIFEPYETSCVSTQIHQLHRWRGRPFQLFSSTQVLEVVEPLIMLRSSEMKRKNWQLLKRLEFHWIRIEELFQWTEGCAFGCCECVTNTKWTRGLCGTCGQARVIRVGGNMVSWRVWTKIVFARVNLCKDPTWKL